MKTSSFSIISAIVMIASLVGCTYEGPTPPDGGNGLTYYRDADGDGYGDPAVSTTNPTGPGWVVVAGDCNDGNAAVHPYAVELCDGLDNNCNSQIDEGCNNPGEMCIMVNGHYYAPQTCTPNGRSDTLAQCDEACTQRCNGGSRYLTCNSQGRWDCVCNSNPVGCNPACGAGYTCQGSTCVPVQTGCNPACGAGYVCQNNTCVPTTPQGCNPACGAGYTCQGTTCVPISSGPTATIRARCTLKATLSNGVAIPTPSVAFGINPEYHRATPGAELSAAPAGCVYTNSRVIDCTWTQPTNTKPIAFQRYYDLPTYIRYVDEQTGLESITTQNRIYGCTQEQTSPMTAFDHVDVCEYWIDGVPTAFTAVDNSSYPKYPNGPRCGNGCNDAPIGLSRPSNECTRNM